MWLNSVRSIVDNKPLSPIELLVLGTATDDALNASQFVERLNKSALMWQGQAGTLYPILHRLTARGLLEKSGNRNTDFNITKNGKRLLDHSLNPLKSQIKETNNYYLTIIDLLMSMKSAPMGLHDFLTDIEKDSMKFLEMIHILKDQAKSIKDDSYEVSVRFE